MSEKVILDELERSFKELDELWGKYSEKCRQVLERWDEVRIDIVRRISEYTGILLKCEEEGKEIEVKARIGLIPQDKVEEKIRNIEKIRSEYSTKLEELKDMLEKMDEWSSIHKRRIGLGIQITSIEDIRNRLEKLETLYKEGKISDRRYKEIKSQLLQQLPLLEASE